MKKIAVIYGKYENSLQKKAVSLLSEIILDYTFEYPVCAEVSESEKFSDRFRIFVGTKESNEYIRSHSTALLSHAEGYSIEVSGDTAIIEGFDDAGALYGCIDFYNKYLVHLEYPHDPVVFRVNPLERALPEFKYCSYPSIKSRGIWTWGHGIYDYRSFIDNMVNLKLNTIIIWNDFAPLNAREMIEYAHSLNIKLIWGYSWLWDTNCGEFSIENAESSIDGIIEKYEKEYLPLGGDGIYFQSFTETGKETVDGIIIAEAVTNLVNKASARLLEKYPDLELQFGLHAESVKKRLEYIKKVDPRVRIVWENCGSFPFGYIPKKLDNFDQTVEFVDKISHLRGENDRFGVVTKSLVKLDWSCFEHLDGQISLGVSSKYMANNRIERKSKIWRYIQAYWLTSAPKAHEMAKALRDFKDGDLVVTALVEDGMFEKNIMFPVALYCEMLWDTDGNTTDMINEVALRGYVDFA